MEPLAQKIIVVGGNGFLGSAVCKAALARGMQVTSISSSGRPYTTPKGHTPAWVSKVNWVKADALVPATYSHLLPAATGVVHTLGTLLEDPGKYKKAIKESDVFGLLGSVLGGGSSSNPLKRGSGQTAYDILNRDSALQVAQAFAESTPKSLPPSPRPFVFVSAEDIFRPVVSTRYIESKREAEAGIERLALAHPDRLYGVYMRPSLIYHPHFRPLSTPFAAALDLSATLHRNAPRSFPTPASVLRALAPVLPTPPPQQQQQQDQQRGSSSSSPLYSIANALTIPPIHVEHVAEAICVALGGRTKQHRHHEEAGADVEYQQPVSGVVDVARMRELIGWADKGAGGSATGVHVHAA